MFHLVTYATAKYRHRQIFLSESARANGVVHRVDSWTPGRLAASGFPKLAPGVSLSERGSGFWAWKPFIIQEALAASRDGEIVFYCDVGRKYPYILLEHPLDPFVDWMDAARQDVMPGVNIPWNGPMSVWTKREAWTATNMDRPEFRDSSPIQASFSFWRASPGSRAFVADWLSLCVQRRLVSDDPDPSGEPEYPGFRAHRHDQSLLTLCCLKHGIKGIDLGPAEPGFNERDPGQLAERWFSARREIRPAGRIIRMLAGPIQATERLLRERMTFGRKYE